MANNKTRYAVLGMLSVEPMSGYDIGREMKASINYFWSESDGQLYPTLKTLYKEGKISMQEESSAGGRTRKIYQLTQVGRDELKKWLREPMEKITIRDELLLKLFFGANVPPTMNIARIEESRMRAQARVAEFEEIKAEIKREFPGSKHLTYGLLTLDYGIQHAAATLKWCDEAIKVLKKVGKK